VEQSKSRLLLIVILLMGGVIIWQTSRVKALQSQVEAARQATPAENQRAGQLHELLATLSPPDEILLCDIETAFQVARLRQAEWQKAGMKEFTPYECIAGPVGAVGVNTDPGTWQTLPTSEAEKECYEAFVLNRIAVVCDTAAAQMKANQDLGAYLKSNQKLLERQLHPRLMRLLNARTDSVVLSACRLLLASGDRSDRTYLALKAIRDPFRTEAAKLVQEYSIPTTAASK